MKRRDFLAASMLLSLFGITEVQAAKKSNNKKNAKRSTQKERSAQRVPKKSPKPEAETQSEEIPLSDSDNTMQLTDEPTAQWKNYTLRFVLSLAAIEEKFSLYVPLPQGGVTAWQRISGLHWQGNFEHAGIIRDPITQLEIFAAHWSHSNTEPKLELTSQVALQNRHFDFMRRNSVAEQTEVLRKALRASTHYPIDGIMHSIAQQAIGRIKDPLAQAKALYNWVVDHVIYDETVEDAKIAQLLHTSSLSGNSAVISQIFVALCRSAGIPARAVFGLRMDRSELFKSLGTTGNLNNAMHSRAEFYSPGYGWVPVDPAGVGRAKHYESLSDIDPNLNMLKKLLFGFWEMNWVGLNAAEDITLPNTAETLPYLNEAIGVNANGQMCHAAKTALHAETSAILSAP